MNKRPHSLPVPFPRPIAALLLLLVFCPLHAEDADSLDMLAPALKDVPALKTSRNTVATPVLEDDRVVGVKIEVENSSEQYPGVEIPIPAGGWDLSSFVAVEAEVENVGYEKITSVLGLAKRGVPTSYTTGVRLAPGQTGVIRVRFGYHWGAPTEKIDLQAVDLVRVYLLPDQSGAFVIKSLRAVRN